MNTKIADIQKDRHFSEKQGKSLRAVFLNSAFVFVVAFFVLLFSMSLRPNVYDEGIVLTASMRVAAGQLPHRDFYAIYGPALFYILAGLYKLLGQSILIERLFDLFFRALLVSSVYAIASLYLRRSIAVVTSVATLVWLFGLYFALAGNAVIEVSFFNLIGTALILPIFTRTIATHRIFAAGAIAGIATLFRYDTGIALFGVHSCVITIGLWGRLKEKRLSAFISVLWPYLAGFVLVTLPPALYYLSLAPLHPLIHDIILFPRQYYHRARSLPFPAITLKGLDNFAVYLPVVVAGISLYTAFAGGSKMRDDKASSPEKTEQQRMYGFLIAFSFLASAMYLKGLVRTSVIHMYLATIPTLLLTAMLFQKRFVFHRIVRIFIVLVTGVTLLSPVWSALREMRDLYVQHSSLPERMWSAYRQTTPAIEATWCKSTNPATRGLCFLPEDDRIQTIEFIDSHTRPDQTLFVGLTHHDRIFANDNITYFVSHRLPATRWSHFDPDLQNRPDIQAQMIQELEMNSPPYVVLDSEFDLIYEPNDSSRSSGVKLLDEYLHEKYRYTRTFGRMSVWQRIPSHD